MSMNVGSSGGSDAPMMEMNMTPLIDVLLVLIILLIMTLPIQNHSVSLNMPTISPPLVVEPPVVVTIDVDFDGAIYWNKEVVPDRDALETKLKKVAEEPKQPEVHLHPDKMVSYKFVAAVLASAQRLGVTNIGVVGNEQFIEN